MGTGLVYNVNAKLDKMGTFTWFVIATLTFIGAIAVSLFMLFDVGGLQIHKIIPGISAAAALNALRTARKIYKATKNLRKALKVLGGWSIVSLLISIGGDWLVGMLLNGNLKSLASW